LTFCLNSLPFYCLISLYVRRVRTLVCNSPYNYIYCNRWPAPRTVRVWHCVDLCGSLNINWFKSKTTNRVRWSALWSK